MPTIPINAPGTTQIDLGDAQQMVITAINGTAEVYIDYQRVQGGSYVSAIRGSAGYGDPFYVHTGTSKVVRKSDLESERVRVGTKNADIKIAY